MKKYVIGLVLIILLISCLSGCNESDKEDTITYDSEYLEFLQEYNKEIQRYNDNINNNKDEDNEDMIVYWCEKAINDLYSTISELYDFQISNELVICRNYSIKGYNYLFDGYRDLINGYTGNPDYFTSAQENFAKFSSYHNLASNCYDDL